VIDLSSSSDEEDLITAASRDFEFTQRLFGELNRAVMGPLGNGKLIVLSNSKEEEVREEKTINTEDATAFVAINPTSTTSADADDALGYRTKKALRQACFEDNFNGSTLLFLHLFVERNWDHNAKPLTYFHTLHACFNLL
jgi:hypothetical protein